MSESPHHIRRHVLDLQIRGQDTDGPRARNAASDWQKRVWLPLLERVLDEMDTEEDTIVIDRLEIDLDHLTPAEWNSGAESIAMERLREAVRQKLQCAAERGGPANHRPLEAMAHYLRTGTLPWWCPASVKAAPGAWLRDWIEKSDASTITAEIPTLLHSSAARTRLAAEMHDDVFWKLVRALAGGDGRVWEEEYLVCQEVLRNAKAPAEAFCVACRAAILGATLYMPNADNAVRHFVHELTPLIGFEARAALAAHLDALHGAAEAAEKRRREAEAASPEGLSSTRDAALDSLLPADALAFGDWRVEDALHEEELHTHYLSNGAGAALFAPFLPSFFKALGLVEGSSLTDAARAAVLVHYLASGEQKYGEWELVLPKILCGLSPAALVPTAAVALRPEEREEAEALLASLIEHWSVLKNTSPDGLRHSFLQREGRLTEKEGAWRLLVQPAAHDVLLQHLPWSISIVKLPWMDAPLYVDWE